jgi:hypothetical protein
VGELDAVCEQTTRNVENPRNGFEINSIILIKIRVK